MNIQTRIADKRAELETVTAKEQALWHVVTAKQDALHAAQNQWNPLYGQKNKLILEIEALESLANEGGL